MAVAALATFSLFLAWVGAAVVALVVLRVGIAPAMSVVFAALIPATFWAYALNDVGPLTTIVCVTALAALLRTSRSWSTTLVLMPMVLGLCTLATIALAPEFVAYFHGLVLKFIAAMQASISELDPAKTDPEAMQQMMDHLKPPTELQIMGLYAVSQAMTVLFSLCLARWWQALAFNPGGFQQEFHQLKLTKLGAVLCVLGIVLVSNIQAYAVWALLFVLPMLVAGLALVHGLIAQNTKSGHWIILFYIALAFAPNQILAILTLLALVDSAVGFRKSKTAV